MKRIILLVAFALVVAIGADAQAIYKMYNSLGSGITSDTVTNAGVGVLTTASRTPILKGSRVNAQITITKISGTVGGTITLQGSVDGVAWKAVQTLETQTGLSALTATDVASQTFHYKTVHYYPYYRWSWTGTGTMAASFTGTLFVGGNE
jgi:hypothetical protein